MLFNFKTTRGPSSVCFALAEAKCFVVTFELHVFYFISTPFFPAQPGVAYRKAVFEPQVCLDVCLTNQKTFVHEITKKVVLDTIELGIVYD